MNASPLFRSLLLSSYRFLNLKKLEEEDLNEKKGLKITNYIYCKL